MKQPTKTVFIIPGYTGKTDRYGYRHIAAICRKRGFRVIPIDIHWKNRTITNYLQQAEEVIKNDPAKDRIIIGFSFGAYMSLVMSTRMALSAQILCSLSPYFKETLPRIPRDWKMKLGKRRITAFRDYSYRALAKNVACRTTLLFTELEHPLVAEVSKHVYHIVRVRKSIREIKGIKHNIHRPEYIDAVGDIIRKL